jgi:hypothetical protein
MPGEAGLDSNRDTEILQELVLHKLYKLCIAQATQLLLQHGKRNNGLRHSPMATSATKRPKDLARQFSYTFSMRIVAQRNHQIAAKDARNDRAFDTLDLQTKLGKLWQNIFPFDEPKMGKERTTNNRSCP